EEAAEGIREIVRAVESEDRAIPVLVHGGPLNDVGTVGKVLDSTGAAGYVTGSTGERLPTEEAVKLAVEAFKKIKLRYQA
ncbi:MAG: phosphoenolpyruvate hydrolase family protein, partial [Synergistaceae bacterium]|nr:phosphoenolpyruvate hydrolase family protein [Synergistaceae bacterium]